MSPFAWLALLANFFGGLQMVTGTAVRECEVLVLMGLVFAVLHVGYILSIPHLREQRAAKQLAR